jgi:hypothetical protein
VSFKSVLGTQKPSCHVSSDNRRGINSLSFSYSFDRIDFSIRVIRYMCMCVYYLQSTGLSSQLSPFLSNLRDLSNRNPYFSPQIDNLGSNCGFRTIHHVRRCWSARRARNKLTATQATESWWGPAEPRWREWRETGGLSRGVPRPIPKCAPIADIGQ